MGTEDRRKVTLVKRVLAMAAAFVAAAAILVPITVSPAAASSPYTCEAFQNDVTVCAMVQGTGLYVQQVQVDVYNHIGWTEFESDQLWWAPGTSSSYPITAEKGAWVASGGHWSAGWLLYENMPGTGWLCVVEQDGIGVNADICMQVHP